LDTIHSWRPLVTGTSASPRPDGIARGGGTPPRASRLKPRPAADGRAATLDATWPPLCRPTTSLLAALRQTWRPGRASD